VVPLLLYKCRIGDDSPQVLGECFGALLDAGDEIGLDYAIECLGDEDGVRAHTAALALGQSRRGEALPVLIEFAGTNCYGPNWRVGLVAIATLRTEAALDHLVALIAEADAEEAAGALDALSMYAMDRRLAERVRGAVARRGDDALARDLAARFPN
jgi:hypothetical protein